MEESTTFIVVSSLVSLKRAQLYALSGEPAGRIPAARSSPAQITGSRGSFSDVASYLLIKGLLLEKKQTCRNHANLYRDNLSENMANDIK